MLINWFKQLLAERQIKTDAALDVNTVDELIIKGLGLRPVFDPVGNPLHARVAENLRKQIEIEEAEEDLHKVEDQLAKYPTSTALLTGEISLFSVEILSCILLLASLGFPNPDRVILGIALAALLFMITGAVARTASRKSEGDVRSRSKSLWAVSLVYIIIVAIFTILRYSEAASNEATTSITDLAFALLMTLISVGPSWGFEYLFRRHEPVISLQKERKKTRKRIQKLQFEFQAAAGFVNRFAKDREAWDRRAATMRAHYATVFRRERARIAHDAKEQNNLSSSRNLPALRKTFFQIGRKQNDF